MSNEYSLVDDDRPWVAPAHYTEQPIPTYVGNPLIEALGSLCTEDELIIDLEIGPKFYPEQRYAAKENREAMLADCRRFYRPIQKSIEVAKAFHSLVRDGYVGRNPITFGQRSRRLHENVVATSADFYDDGVTTSGMTIIGISGVGKTAIIKNILRNYPQVISHTSYGSDHFIAQQLVFLRLECPPNGRPRALYDNAIDEVDRLLGTNYSRAIAGKNSDQKLNFLRTIAKNQHLGVLIIDEIQNLHGAKEGRVLLNSLVQITNTIRVPLVLIGTPEAQHVLTNEFRILRRGAGYGLFLWDRMSSSGSFDSPDDWELFVDGLWKFQYVRNPADLSTECSQALYRHSQGIPDIAIKLFISAQKRAIRTDIETVTPDLIHSVSVDEFPLINDALEAIRIGTPNALSRYHDLSLFRPPSDVESSINQPIGIPSSGKLPSEIATNSNTRNPYSSSQTTRTPETKVPELPNNLIQTVGHAETSDDAYLRLREANIILDVDQYLVIK